jgi:2-phosphoglycolate phosphatase
MHNRPQGILFDLDGTLLDTAPEFTHCLNKLLSESGKSPLPVSQVREKVSFGAKSMVGLGFGVAPTDPDCHALAARLIAIYEAHIGQRTVFFPGIFNLLTLLQKKKIPWGIVTNKLKTHTFPLIQQFPPLSAAGCIVAGDTLSTAKPDPAPLLHACEQLNLSPTACWYVGDAKTDVEASRQAGMRCAVAHYGYIPQNENALDWQADHYLKEAEEMVALFF